jgi:two-component system, OmpR family, response regulator MprA
MERSILIVDDDHDVADLLADLLDEEGYRVRCAFDDQAALREIEREAPDLVVVDVLMPHGDGLTLTNQMRARGIGIPVVLVSAVYADVDVPGVQFVPKPFDLDYIIQVIARVFADLGR